MNHMLVRKAPLWSVVALTILAATACRSQFEGTYSNANGSIMLEVKSGGKASLTIMGETAECTYTVGGNQLTVDCKGDKTVFTRHDDESLTGPPGSMIGALRKSK